MGKVTNAGGHGAGTDPQSAGIPSPSMDPGAMSGNERCPVCALLAAFVDLTLDEALMTLRAFDIYRLLCAQCGMPWAAHQTAHPHLREGERKPCVGLVAR